ncbi:MAG: hypothetical protein DWB44_08380 [Chloroflexi bacterium]|nr:hypothetical protein [Chloroflexota bacterium]RIK20535.1 MAG: hypothetical protein DCC53_10150 [Chloroflexota bacterium]
MRSAPGAINSHLGSGDGASGGCGTCVGSVGGGAGGVAGGLIRLQPTSSSAFKTAKPVRSGRPKRRIRERLSVLGRVTDLRLFALFAAVRGVHVVSHDGIRHQQQLH